MFTLRPSLLNKIRALLKARRGRKLRRRRHAALRFEALETRWTMSHVDTTAILPRLTIYINGIDQVIPANIGVTGSGNTATYANPHTLDVSGALYEDETAAGGVPVTTGNNPVLPAPAGIGNTVRNVTIGDFFDVWRTAAGTAGNDPNAVFDSTHILGNTVDANHTLKMYVNGVLNAQYQNYVPEDGDDVVIDYEPIAATNAPTFAPIPTTQVDNTSPLMVPLAGTDPQGQALTYTVTVANPALLQATLEPTTNDDLKISTSQGDMVFSLFDDLAPRVTAHMESLINSGFYNNTPNTPSSFYRVVDNFLIQGGPGTGVSPLGKFDDQFNLNLQLNRRGILAMAKITDDTSDSEFFVTDQATQFLDFNYSVWGLLVEGDNVRQAISDVAVHATTSSGEVSTPNTPVTINSMSLFHSNQDGVLMLKALANSGATDVTVTATDTSGHSHSQTFHVLLSPEIANGGPFLNDIPSVKTTTGTPATFTLTSQDQEGDAVNYAATSAGSVTSTVQVGTTSGLVTVTPPANFVGTAQVNVSVTNAPGTPNGTADKFDSELVNVTVAPLAPTSVSLAAASDTGLSSSDSITNKTNGLQFTVNGVTSGATVKLFDGSTLIGSASASGTSVTITATTALSDAVHSVMATQTVNSVDSTSSPALNVTVDTTPPAFTSTPPATAKAGTQLSYQAAATFADCDSIFTLFGPLSAIINATSGLLTWTPTSTQTGSQSLAIIATDAAGNTRYTNRSTQCRRRLFAPDGSNPLSCVRHRPQQLGSNHEPNGWIAIQRQRRHQRCPREAYGRWHADRFRNHFGDNGDDRHQYTPFRRFAFHYRDSDGEFFG